jgi:ferritin-like metal-binding protein YciE
MGLFSKDLKSLEDLFNHGLEDLYYAENQILKSLPKMIDNAHDAELKRGLQQHRTETEGQIKRLERVFALDDKPPRGVKCPGIDGILREGDELLGEMEGDDVMNVGIVAAAQAVEHYEITRYGTLIAWAKELGRKGAVPLLAANLKEEKAADEKLTRIAERRVNPKGEGRAPRAGGGRKKSASAGRRKAASAGGRKSAASRAKSSGRSAGGRKAAAKRKSTAKRKRA